MRGYGQCDVARDLGRVEARFFGLGERVMTYLFAAWMNL